jgi:hypothetical protein
VTGGCGRVGGMGGGYDGEGAGCDAAGGGGAGISKIIGFTARFSLGSATGRSNRGVGIAGVIKTHIGVRRDRRGVAGETHIGGRQGGTSWTYGTMLCSGLSGAAGRGDTTTTTGKGHVHSHRSETRSARSPSLVANFSIPLLNGASRLRRGGGAARDLVCGKNRSATSDGRVAREPMSMWFS